MSAHDDSPSDPTILGEALELLVGESQEADRLAGDARAATDDPKAIARAARGAGKAVDAKSEMRWRGGLEKALQIDPACPLALVAIARSFESPVAAATLLQAVVEIAERRVGPEAFEQEKGSFGARPETSHYIYALFALAEAQLEAGDFAAGFDVIQRIVALADLDLLDRGHALIGILLAADCLEQARAIAFERYAGEQGAAYLWARTLILYCERDFAAATAMLERAQEANSHVEELLMGDVEPPEEMPKRPDPGSFEEGAIIVSDLGGAWRFRPLALIWLLQGGGLPGDGGYHGGYTAVDPPRFLEELSEAEEEDWEDALVISGQSSLFPPQ